MPRGENKGKEEGESLLGKLIERLLADGKIEEARQAAVDPEARKKYYAIYGIVSE